jgi:LPXTG-site transpeptidase (sortase) family protein
MFQNLFDRILGNKLAFLGTFFLVFFSTYLFLVAIDFVPEPKVQREDVVVEKTATTTIEKIVDKNQVPPSMLGTQTLPDSVYIKKLDRTVSVANPDSRAIADLDAALLHGVVRHPDSADLAQDGNVFILGHSSYLPNVINKNFQAFNGIQDLKWGDIIEVTSDSHVFIYEVEKVYKASAEDLTVPISGTGPRLTLATCNSFGSKDDRFIVEAKRVEIRAL